MNSFIRQGKALPVEVRNIVGKWLHNEGIASIVNINSVFNSVLSSVLLYFSSVLQFLRFLDRALIEKEFEGP